MSIDAQINFGNVVSGSAAKPSAINGTFIYARWTGYIVPSVTGPYTLGLNSGDDANLFIGDTPLVSGLGTTPTPNSTTAYNASAPINLTAGVPYAVTVEWQHGAGTNYEIQLLWTPPGGSVQVIPSANLSTSKTSITDNLAGSWWNGTSGLWYPSGPGVIDFASPNQVNKNQDNVGDGTTFKRLAHVNSDNLLHVSTALNPQASILPNQVVLITLSMPDAATIIASWLVQSLLRPDSSSLTVPASTGSSLLTDGDFESGTAGSQATGWTNVSGFGLTTVNTNTHGGSKAGNINNTSGNTSINLQVVSVTGGQTYLISGWVKADALPNVPAHFGGGIQIRNNSGVTGFTIITKFGAFDAGNTSFPDVALPANGVAHAYTLLQCYFIPATSGSVTVAFWNQSNGGNVWFDDVQLNPYSGVIYTGLTASTSYYLYPYIEAATGLIKFANGAPPSTSPSDSLSLQCSLDGRIACPPVKATMPTSGGSGSTSGGGSGTCPEISVPVYIRRYSDAGELVFDGQVKAGEVRHGWESDDGIKKRGDFLKGYSFAKQEDVYRAVQHFKHVPCAGWMMLEGARYTACETVWNGPLNSGQWLPAWKVPGAVFDGLASTKIHIQVKADGDAEHNYYAGSRLIHNAPVLPC
jgi:hypothetical protein